MPSLQYRLGQKVSNGRSEVLVRFYAGTSFSQRAKSRIFVPVSAWDSAACALIIPRKITPDTVELSTLQRQLDALRDDIFSHWWQEQYDAGPDWLQSTIDRQHNINIRTAQDRLLLSDLVITYTQQNKSIGAVTLSSYTTLSNSIARFDATKRHPTYVDSVTPDDMRAYCAYLESINTGQNTISNRFKKLSGILRWAERKHYLAESPIGKDEDGKFEPPQERYGSIVYLTREERDRLTSFDGLPPHLAVTRDIFIFQCHVGCRVSDLFRLTRENITDGNILQYVPKKTSNTRVDVVRVPLTSVALEIIDRYKDIPGSYIIPHMADQVYNRQIHDMLRLAGFDRMVIIQDPKTMRPVNKPLWEVVTSHAARRTFAMLVFKQTRSEKVSASLTGHVPHTRSFSRYAEVDDEMRADVIHGIDKT